MGSSQTEIDTTGKDRLSLDVDGEVVEVFNHATISQHHYVNSVNGHERVEINVGQGDMAVTPDAITKRLADILYTEFNINAEKEGIRVVDTDDEDVYEL